MSSSTGLPSDAMAPDEFGGGTAAACVILGLSFLVGFPGNLLVIWTILRHVQRRSHTVVLMLHLAAADLLVLVTLPLWIYSLARSWVFGEASCKAVVYVINACMYGSVFLITLMSVERMAAVRFPFASAGWRRKAALNKVLLVVWAAAFLFSVPVIPTQILDGDAGEEQCLFRKYASEGQEAAFVLLETLVGYVVPLCVLLVCYGCLCCRIAQMTFRSKRKSTYLIAAVVAAFALCWTPHHVGNVLSLVQLALTGADWQTAQRLEGIRGTAAFVAGALAFISSAVNPVLYALAARSFRSSLRDTGIQKLFRHISSTSPGEGAKELSFVSKRQSSRTHSTQSIQSIQNTYSTQSIQDTQSIQNTYSTQSIQSIQNTQRTQRIQDTQNTQRIQDTQNTQSNHSIQSTQSETEPKELLDVKIHDNGSS